MIRKLAVFIGAILVLSHPAIAQNVVQSGAPTIEPRRGKILVHITQGPENPTRAALGFLVAKTAIDNGHSVTLFLAGDAVHLLRDSVVNNLTGLGTGKLRDHLDGIVKGGGKFYLSGMSSRARGVTDADLRGKSAEFAMPDVLIRLALESDRVFTY